MARVASLPPFLWEVLFQKRHAASLLKPRAETMRKSGASESEDRKLQGTNRNFDAVAETERQLDYGGTVAF